MLTPRRGTESLSSHHYYRQPLKAAVFFCLLPLATRKRVHILFEGDLIICQVFFQLVLDILLDHLRILSYRVRKVPYTKNFGFHIYTSDSRVCRKSSVHFYS